MENSKHAVRPGIWTHHSGTKFEVIGIASGSSYVMGDLVIYRGLRSGQLFYRTGDEFLGSEDVDDYTVPRFTFTSTHTGRVNFGALSFL